MLIEETVADRRRIAEELAALQAELEAVALERDDFAERVAEFEERDEMGGLAGPNMVDSGKLAAEVRFWEERAGVALYRALPRCAALRGAALSGWGDEGPSDEAMIDGRTDLPLAALGDRRFRATVHGATEGPFSLLPS